MRGVSSDYSYHIRVWRKSRPSKLSVFPTQAQNIRISTNVTTTNGSEITSPRSRTLYFRYSRGRMRYLCQAEDSCWGLDRTLWRKLCEAWRSVSIHWYILHVGGIFKTSVQFSVVYYKTQTRACVIILTNHKKLIKTLSKNKILS